MTALRPDLAIIAQHIRPGASVLDIGCGDGALMAALRTGKGIDARGLELDAGNVSTAVGKGLPVVQGDADRDLADYMTGSFDYAVLSHALQTMQRPAQVLEQLLRIGRAAFVSFPNFAHWRVRRALALGGRMPVNRMLPEAWHETGNIHHLSIADFKALAKDKSYAIEADWYLAHGKPIAPRLANLRAEQAVFLLKK